VIRYHQYAENITTPHNFTIVTIQQLKKTWW